MHTTDLTAELPAGQAAAAEAPAATRIVIEPKRGWLAVNWAELWQYRELLFFLTWRDVKVRYKQTVLGFTWAFVQPFLKLVVFSAVFGGVAKIDSGGFPYPIFLYSALLPWQFFGEALARSSQSVVGGANLVTRVYFPRLIIPLASVGACLVDFAISFSILVGLMLFYGMMPGAAIAAIVPLVVLTVFTALGVGTFLSALTVAYRDFRYVVPFMVQLWMFLTPVLYSLNNVHGAWGRLILLNPMTGIVEAYRSAILSVPFKWGPLGLSAAIAAVLFAAGVMYFRRVEARFADIV